MITIYRKQSGNIISQPLTVNQEIPKDVLWIDMVSPTQEEELSIERQLGVAIPSKEEVWKNQVMNRLYKENDIAYMTVAIITKLDCPYPQTSPVTLILSPNYLITMRSISPTSFNNFSQRIIKNPSQFSNSYYVLEGLMEEIITRIAHNSEVVVDKLDHLSHDIFSPESLAKGRNNSSGLLKNVLAQLSTCADLISKINESLNSIGRTLTFFKQMNAAGSEINDAIEILITDGKALLQQNKFLSDKITFQLDATLGMINVEQNLVIKIFSVVTVFFLPPTLITSMYGMNFHDMPELSWHYGYPMALVLMVFCAITPFVYFRKKGWL